MVSTSGFPDSPTRGSHPLPGSRPFEEIPTVLTLERVPPILRDEAFLTALRDAFGTLAGQLQDLRRAAEPEQRALGEALAYLLDTSPFGRWLRSKLVKESEGVEVRETIRDSFSPRPPATA